MSQSYNQFMMTLLSLFSKIINIMLAIFKFINLQIDQIKLHFEHELDRKGIGGLVNMCLHIR